LNQKHFKFWPVRMPKELYYPEVPLFEFLETSARRYPDKTAIIYYGRLISYKFLWEAVLRLANALISRGIKKGDRVALYLQNTPHFIIGFYGAMRAGAVVVPINPMLLEKDLEFILRDTGAKILITSSDLYDRVITVQKDTNLQHIIVGSYDDYLPARPEIPVPPAILNHPAVEDRANRWLDVLESSNPVPPEVDIDYNDLALLPYTAGSTGIPKGCMHTHATIISNTVSTAVWHNLTSSSMVFATLPLFHVTGMQHSMNAAFYAGSTMVLLTRWDRETALTAIEKYRCSHWITISTMVVDLLSDSNISQRDLSSIMIIGGGGAPLPEAIGRKLKELTGLEFVEGYGLTETISQTHMNPPDRPKLQCIGIPDFGVDARIIDADTLQELPPGQEGELVVAGPEVFKGYWNRPQDTEEAFIDLGGKRFFKTGDICRMDDEGYFYIIDRSKRMINASGFKVWPAEIEGILYGHPAVAEACVVGVPDPYRIENVKAYIVLKNEYRGKISEDEIIKWCKEKMAAYKYPRIVEFIDELPKSGAGKILWRQLQEQERKKKA